MGLVKEDWMEWQEQEHMREWIEEKYGSLILEGTPDWHAAVQEFHQYCLDQERIEREIHEQEEYDYYMYLRYGETYELFHSGINELKGMLENAPDNLKSSTFFKMLYAHSVTLLEVYLESIVKTLILSDRQFLINTIENVRPFNDTKIMLKDISTEDGGIQKFVLGKISDNLFHDIPKVINILSGVLGKKINIEIDEICKVTSIRHDIVHRNGKNKSSDNIGIDADSTYKALIVVEGFANELRSAL